MAVKGPEAHVLSVVFWGTQNVYPGAFRAAMSIKNAFKAIL
jgi:hypothetical protein